MPSAEMRQRLAEQQAALVEALTVGKTPPPGFAAERFAVAAEALARKRARSASKAMPILAQSLGERFGERFAAFAAVTPLPEEGGPFADARAFARYVAARGELPEDARLEVMAVDLHQKSTRRGLVPRRGFALRAAVLWRARRFVLGIRVPWLGVRWLSLPFGRRA
ncbi:MAG TPA: hypothetical protein VEL76_03775 [Gemmataceae bacterium]|nr:hypothetical protein [Gemmataceae bacterium]